MARARGLSLRDRRGTVALVFALMIVPILALGGLVIDAGMTMTARSGLDLAADAAALAAVTAAVSDLPTDSSNYLTVGKTAGANRFLAQAGSIASVTKNTPTLSVVRSGNAVQATITWTASYVPFFGSLFGVNSFWLSGTASASAPIGSGYTDIYILFDNSSSMELPATADGITKLQSATKSLMGAECAYACHSTTATNSSWNKNYNDAYGLARYENIELRFDVIIETLKLIVATIQSNNSGGIYRIGIYTFDEQLNQAYPPHPATHRSAATLHPPQTRSMP